MVNPLNLIYVLRAVNAAVAAPVQEYSGRDNQALALKAREVELAARGDDALERRETCWTCGSAGHVSRYGFYRPGKPVLNPDF
jgi:hypothetical protein